MPPTPPIQTSFPNGLQLREVTYAQVNANKTAGTGLMSWPVSLVVPKTTKFVHVAVTCAEITPNPPAGTPACAVSRIGFEITNPNTSGLSAGQYSCQLRAVFEDGSANPVNWTGYFVLEVLCFG